MPSFLFFLLELPECAYLCLWWQLTSAKASFLVPQKAKKQISTLELDLSLDGLRWEILDDDPGDPRWEMDTSGLKKLIRVARQLIDQLRVVVNLSQSSKDFLISPHLESDLVKLNSTTNMLIVVTGARFQRLALSLMVLQVDRHSIKLLLR